MSTQINITVDSGGLSRKAKQQTTVNRLLKMEDDHQKKVGNEAMDKRTDVLKAKQLGPDGRPFYGTQLPLSTRKEELAAWRRSDYLPYFWYHQTFVSVDGKSYLKLSVYSGDLAESAEYTFSSPSTSSHLSSTVPTLPAAPNWPNVADFFTGLPPNELGLGKDYREQQDNGGGVKDVCITNGSSVLLTAPDGYTAYQSPKRTRRQAYGYWTAQSSRQRLLMLPLGNKKALVLAYIRQAAHNRVASFSEESITTPISIGNQVVPGNNFSRIVTTNTSFSHGFSVEVKDEIDQEECVCFLVSQTSATIIATPPLLLSKLREHVGQLVRVNKTGTFTFMNACPTVALDYYTYNHSYPSGSTFVDPITGATKNGFTYSYVDFAFQRENESVADVDFNNGDSQMKYAGYGLMDKGSYVSFAACPLGWYYLDSVNSATEIVTATTHEQLRAVHAPGIIESVATALPFRKYVGNPAYTGPNPKSLADMVLDGNVYAWRSDGNMFQGSLTELNYTYGKSPWLRQTYLIKKAIRIPSNVFNLVLIYDWDNKSLCSRQRSRYGIP